MANTLNVTGSSTEISVDISGCFVGCETAVTSPQVDGIRKQVTRGIIRVGAETKEVRTSYWRPSHTGTHPHFWNFLLKSNCSNARSNRKLDERTKQSTCPNFWEIPNVSLPGTNVVSRWGWKIHWWYSRTGCWRKCLGLRGSSRRRFQNEELRNCHCHTSHQIAFRLSKQEEWDASMKKKRNESMVLVG